jgi:predicted aspartyl protease
MSFSFNRQQGLILVNAEIEGPSGCVIVQLALDTGATSTLINAGLLVAVGYDPALAPERIQITTGSGVEFAPRVILTSITSLGQTRKDLPVLCHTLPLSTGVDGILGLDFLRDQKLTLDFRSGEILLV